MTFRDAIHVTHQLGLKYLWIDCLCIIHDSPEDWLHEGSMMADIYEYALVTLAATKAPNADSDLFAYSEACEPSYEMTIDSQDNHMEGTVDAIYSREILPHQLHGDPAPPLLARGWANFTRRRKLCKQC
jgi:hypothetical protein